MEKEDLLLTKKLTESQLRDIFEMPRDDSIVESIEEQKSYEKKRAFKKEQLEKFSKKDLAYYYSPELLRHKRTKPKIELKLREYQKMIVDFIIASFDHELNFSIMDAMDERMKEENKLFGKNSKTGEKRYFETKFFKNSIKGVNFIEVGMGLGKTVSVLTALEYLMKTTREIGKAIIFAPAIVAYTVWGAEIEKWSNLSDMTYVNLDNPKTKMMNLVFPKSDIVIASDAILFSIAQFYADNPQFDFPFDAIILDESSRFKNHGNFVGEERIKSSFSKNGEVIPEKERFKIESKRYQSLFYLRDKFKPKMTISLTGTSAPTGVGDVFPQITWMDGGASFTRNKIIPQKMFTRPSQVDFFYRRGVPVEIEKKHILTPYGKEIVPKILEQTTISLQSEDYLKDLPENKFSIVDVSLPKKVISDRNKLQKELMLALEKDGNSYEIGKKEMGANAKRLMQFDSGTMYIDVADITYDVENSNSEYEEYSPFVDWTDNSTLSENEDLFLIWLEEKKNLEMMKTLLENEYSQSELDNFSEGELVIEYYSHNKDSQEFKNFVIEFENHVKKSEKKKVSTETKTKKPSLADKFDEVIEEYPKRSEEEKKNDALRKKKKYESSKAKIGKFKVRDYIVVHEEKLKAVKKIIEEYPEDNFLVIYEFRAELDSIYEYFKDDFVVGTITTTEDVNNWNEGKYKIGLCHPASVAYGLNLQEGGRIAIYYGWNDIAELIAQTNQRLARPGQVAEFVLTFILSSNGTGNRRRINNVFDKLENMKEFQKVIKFDPKQYNLKNLKRLGMK